MLRTFITAVLIAASVTACATLGGGSQTRGLLHGHITSEQISPMRVYIHQPGKMHWGPFGVTARVRSDGTFIVRNLAPGPYYLGGISDGVTVYPLSRRQGVLVELQRGQVASLGSYRVSGEAMALREGTTLQLEPREHPDEAELLYRLADELTGSSWERPVLRRLDAVLHQQAEQ